MAMKLAFEAHKRMDDDPRLLGSGKATAALVLGGLDVVAWGLMLLGRAVGG